MAIDAIAAAPGGTTALVVDGNVFSNSEGTHIGAWVDYDFTTGIFDGGELDLQITHNDFWNGDDNTDIDWTPPPFGSATAEISDNDFHDNYGALVYLYSTELTGTPASGIATSTRDITIARNTGRGGWACVYTEISPGGGQASLTIVDNEMSAYDGECISVWVYDDSLTGQADIVVVNNDVGNNYDVGVGIYSYPSTTDEVNVLVAQNSAAGGFESGSGVLEVSEGDLSHVLRNTFGLNDVDSSDALVLQGANVPRPGYMMVRNNVVAFAAGDGISVSTLQAQLVNNTIFENGHYGSTAAGVVASPTATYSMVHVANSIVDNNGGFDLGNTPRIDGRYSLIGDEVPPTGFGNRAGDPRLVEGTSLADFTTFFALQPTSPARDAGDPALGFNDPDGSRNDMGALGGPGAGPLGFLGRGNAPFFAIGMRPFCDLFTGEPLLEPDDTVLTLIFSEAIGSAPGGALSVSDGDGPVPGSWTLNGRRAVFTAAAPFDAGSVVTITAGTTLTSSTGKPLAFTNRWSCFVEPNNLIEVEPNDATAQAQGLAGQSFWVSGQMDGTSDVVDVYALPLAAGDRLSVTALARRLGNLADFTLTLTDSSGAVVRSGANVFGLDPFIDVTVLADDTYYLTVSLVVAGTLYSYELQGTVQ